MERLKELQPVQIIGIAAGVLLLFSVLSYFIVVKLTSTKPSTAPSQVNVPSDLNSEANKKVVEKLQYFEIPRDLPFTTQPLQTPDPNSPSTVNPFRP